MKVLIVEDEIFAAMHLEAVIEQLGGQVVGIAPDTPTALMLAESKPDLAYVDLNLRDGLTGPEIARTLANRFGTKVLFLTANPAQAGGAFEGLIGVVSKPWSQSDIAEAYLALSQPLPDESA
jgi:two-component system, response regulator PdtaR